MKLLLLQPPVEDFYDTDIRLQPIGLAYLKAAVRQGLPEVDVKIIDLHHGHGRYQLPIPRELQYLKHFYPHADKSPFCGFHGYYHFGASDEYIARVIADEKPDVVGISSLFSPYYREVLKVAQIVKKVSKAMVIVGGSHASAHPESLRASPHVDEVMVGEGEKTLVDFLAKKFGLLTNPVVETLVPDLQDFSPVTYTYKGKPLCFMITSRSCPHKCSFCSVHLTFGHQYRRTKVTDVLAEMKIRYAQGYRVFDFEDDNLTFYIDEMAELCCRIIEEFPKKDIELLAMNGISYLSLTPALLGLMRQAGFTRLNISLVSSDKSVRETTKRPHTLQKYLEVVDVAFRLGFEITSYQIIGLPTETLESMIQTLVTAARLPVLLGASMFYLTPNSPIAKQMGFVHGDEDIFKSRLTAMAIETPEIKREDVYTLFITTRIINFFKGYAVEKPSAKDQRGLEIMARLMQQGVLFADTAQGLKPLSRFKSALFQRIFAQLPTITNVRGQTIFPRDLIRPSLLETQSASI